MSVCYGCSTRFTLFNKDKTCGVCHISFCSKCVTKTDAGWTCQKCAIKTTAVYDPPAALFKRLQQLEDPSRPPVVVFQSNPSSSTSQLKKGLSPKDVELLNRLEKLKEPTVKAPSDDEIRARLQALKGVPEPATAVGGSVPEVAARSQPGIYPTHVSEQEQVDALLAQYIAQTKIEPNTEVDDDRDENSAVEAVMRRAMEEAALPETDDLSPPPSPPVPMEEELPWCELCNGDATIRCLTCDSALYCRRCYKEMHSGEDGDHIHQKYP